MKKLVILLIICTPALLFAQYEDEFKTRADFITGVVYDYGWIDNDNEYRPSGFGGCSGSGSLSDYGKYVYPWMIAHFEKDGASALDGTETEKVKNTFDNEMHQCPAFHFNFVGLPRLIYQYPFEKNFRKNTNGGHLQDYLGMVFNRTDSYNAFTGEGTENHIGMSRLPGYLYAQLAVDSGYTEIFPQAPAMLDSMKHWIMNTTKTIYQTGVAEWNSSTYGAFNIIGWLLIYDFAHDDEVKNAAHAVLDYYAGELALHYQQGINGGPEMRGGSAVKSMNTETDIFSWLWFGDAPKDMNKDYFNAAKSLHTVHAATSTYRPPSIAVQLAKKELTLPAMYHNSKPGYLYENPSLIKQTLYLSKNYSLGAAYTPFGGWGGGDWQIVSWKLAARVEPGNQKDAQYAAGGLEWGGYKKTQLFKKPYEQFAHHKNILVHMTKKPVNHNTIYNEVQSIFSQWRNLWNSDFYQRFPNDTDKNNPISFQEGQAPENQTVLTVSNHGELSSLPVDDIRIVELEKVYIAVRYLNLDEAQPFNDEGDFMLTKDTAPDGNLTGIVLEVFEKSEFSGFIQFRNAVKDHTSITKDLENDRFTYTSFYGDTLEVHYQEEGTFSEPIYDWGYGPSDALVIHRSPPFVQPEWPQGAGYGNKARFWVNDAEVDLDAEWAVYEGPNFKLKNSILELNDSVGNYYVVDYSGDLPVFESYFDPGDDDTSVITDPGGPSWFVYPNPAQNIITIKGDFGKEESMPYRLTDMNGRIILSGVLNNQEVDTRGIPPGIYNLQLLTQDILTARIVIF